MKSIQKVVGLLGAFLVVFLTFSFVAKENKKPTLYLIGDSTVRNGQGDGRNGQWGWGSMIGEYFDLDKISVENKAMGGTSTRTFYNNPELWRPVLDCIQTGDYVIMQFGHNDSSPIVDTLRARGTIKGNGDEYQEIYNPLLKKQETVYSYGAYLRRFVRDIHAKGAVAIICSPIPRNRWTENKIPGTDYASWAEEAAEQSGVKFIPLQDLVIAEYETLGKEKVGTDFFDEKDSTHTLKDGAVLNAQLLVSYLSAHTDIGLQQYIK